GSQTLPDGSELVRVGEFDLAHTMPGIARTYRRLGAPLRRATPPGLSPNPAHTVQPGPGSAVEPEPGSAVDSDPGSPHQAGATQGAPAPVARAGSALLRTWLGLYRTVGLGAYWTRAATDGIAWAPDVVHANDGNTLYPAMRIAHHTGAQVIYDSHELWRHRNAPGRTIRPVVDGVIERRAIHRAAGIITVSPNIAGWLQRTYR